MGDNRNGIQWSFWPLPKPIDQLDKFLCGRQFPRCTVAAEAGPISGGAHGCDPDRRTPNSRMGVMSWPLSAADRATGSPARARELCSPDWTRTSNRPIYLVSIPVGIA